MKAKIYIYLFLLISFSKSNKNYTGEIYFSESEVTNSGEGVEISDTTVTIKKSGSYLATGFSSIYNIIISESKVDLNLQNLYISSEINSPIIVKSKLDNINIISLGNVTLQDLEVENITKGECAVIKIKKQSKVNFYNENGFNLVGKCKNAIKGGSQADIIFKESKGEYIINAYKNGISSDNMLEFNGGKFTIKTETGDAIKSSPDEGDEISLGKIIINSGEFDINSYSDAFQAGNKLIINGGKFKIKTENGYDSKTFKKDIMSAKGFKVSNNITGCLITINDGEFDINTADDAFHSNGNMTIINGVYKIYSGDDALHAKFHLIIGTQDQTKNPKINILHSYEAIEGTSIRIYSGKINTTSTDDGINAAGGDGGKGPRPPGPRPPRNHTNSSDEPGPWPPGPPPHNHSNSSDEPEPGPGPFPPGPRPPRPWGRGNSSYFISIYGGEINVFCAGDGLDSNGNIFIHGGNINVFSQAFGEGRDNEPIDHDGNFTLFDGMVLAAGNRGMMPVHEDILKGNQMYAFYNQTIEANNTIRIKNEKNEIIKEAILRKTVTYTFFTCKGFNEKYQFYVAGKDGKEEKINFIFDTPKAGNDDLDTFIDEGGIYNNEEGKPDKIGGNESNALKLSLGIGIPVLIIIVVVILLLIFKFNVCKKKGENDLLKDQGQMIDYNINDDEQLIN